MFNTAQRLVDLDELVLRCRDVYARRYIQEAVACYRAGAHRACIVSTWNAVVFDYLHKLRELELTGDAEARKQLERFERIRAGGEAELKAALDFERELLKTAAERFELFTPLEREDLARLQSDRNRCAHPSMQSIEDPYQPPAELARLHIRNAVEIMLQREPVQGKAAFDRICAEVASAYFPTSKEKAREQFQAGPLTRARASLVRSLFVGLTKETLNGDRLRPELQRLTSAIGAIVEMHRPVCETLLGDELPSLGREVPDGGLWRLVLYFHAVPGSWDAVGEAVRSKVASFIDNVKGDDLPWALGSALRVPDLRERARQRLGDLSVDGIVQLLGDGLVDDVAERAISVFGSSSGFRQAEQFGQLLLPALGKSIGPDLIVRVIQEAGSNSQIWNATGMPAILLDLYNSTRRHLGKTATAWQAFVQQRIDESPSNDSYYYAYPELRQRLEGDGLWPPP